MDKENEVSREQIVDGLMSELHITVDKPDPAMSRFLPRVYDAIGFDWKRFFEPDFGVRFNGLMIGGASRVGKVKCAVFPTPEVVAAFIAGASEGDMLFLHHPIDLMCGVPGGEKGKGFQPIAPEKLETIKERRLSVFTCHAPLDTHRRIGTNQAIVEALGFQIEEEFYPYGNGNAGRICTIDPIALDEFVARLKDVFEIAFVDFLGASPKRIQRIALIAGGGDDVEAMEFAEKNNCDLYLTGEIRSNHTWEDFGLANTEKVEAFAKTTKMALIGVSHAASEFLVMKTQMIQYFSRTFGVATALIPQQSWWR